MKALTVSVLILLVTVSAILDGDDQVVRFETLNGTSAEAGFGMLMDQLLGFSNGEKVCTTTGLNIRSSAGTGASILFTTSDGEQLTITSSQTWNADGLTWSQVSGRSKTGYAASKYLVACGGGGGSGGTVNGPCGSFSDPRTAVVNAAWALYNERAKEVYTQGGTRWSGITQRVCPPAAPPASDCSSSTTWAYWTVYGNGADFINGERWTAGYTGTQISHGKETTSPQPGDLVFYGASRSAISHVAMYVGNGKVISHGSDPVSYVDKNYRRDLQFIKSYL